MADFYENKQVTEEVILVGVALGRMSHWMSWKNWRRQPGQ